jgi:hypothetical protein
MITQRPVMTSFLSSGKVQNRGVCVRQPNVGDETGKQFALRTARRGKQWSAATDAALANPLDGAGNRGSGNWLQQGAGP